MPESEIKFESTQMIREGVVTEELENITDVIAEFYPQNQSEKQMDVNSKVFLPSQSLSNEPIGRHLQIKDAQSIDL
jgi:hypothetical protein